MDSLLPAAQCAKRSGVKTGGGPQGRRADRLGPRGAHPVVVLVCCHHPCCKQHQGCRGSCLQPTQHRSSRPQQLSTSCAALALRMELVTSQLMCALVSDRKEPQPQQTGAPSSRASSQHGQHAAECDGPEPPAAVTLALQDTQILKRETGAASASSMSRPWSPAVRGAGLRVETQEVLSDPKAALSEVLQCTPGWQVRHGAMALSVPAVPWRSKP